MHTHKISLMITVTQECKDAGKPYQPIDKRSLDQLVIRSILDNIEWKEILKNISDNNVITIERINY